MKNKILGIHHITAIAGNAQRNVDFYTRVLGLRLVKKTVNFDDPGTYHLYYGDKTGSPGSILTFFPWANISRGKNGIGMATDIGYAVPLDSLDAWKERFIQNKVEHGEIEQRFGESILPFKDPDGLQLHLVSANRPDERVSWITNEIKEDIGIKGFSSVSLTLQHVRPTGAILTSIFGYKETGQEGNRIRFETDAINTANIIDLIEDPGGQRGVNAAGTNHHVAFRVADDEVLMDFRQKIVEHGFRITEKIDRNYFYSLYFREPGGVLFELASDNPGFMVDETEDELGKNLKLPAQYEPHRSEIEKVLPTIY